MAKGRNPWQFDRKFNLSYIPDWVGDHFFDPQSIGDGTNVGIVIPLRNSQQHITDLLDRLLVQTHPALHIYIVGGKDDKTWSGMQDDLRLRAGINLSFDAAEFPPVDFASPADAIKVWRGTHVTLIECSIPEDWEGRDSNIKRNVGALFAIDDGADVLMFTDAKIIHPNTWVRDGLVHMREQKVESVAGIMVGTDADGESFWSQFADGGLIRRNPRFSGYLLSAENFGDRESLPITATWAMSVATFVRAGGLDIRFTTSYEDYSMAWRVALSETPVYCTGDWVVRHKHRKGLRNVWLENVRSGAGAAMLSYFYEDCPFAIRRIRQVVAVLGALVIVLPVLLYLVIAGLTSWLAAVAAIGLVGYTGLGALNVSTTKYPLAFFFPALTMLGILAFTWGFTSQFIERGGGRRIMQSVWSLIVRTQ